MKYILTMQTIVTVVLTMRIVNFLLLLTKVLFHTFFVKKGKKQHDSIKKRMIGGTTGINRVI